MKGNCEICGKLIDETESINGICMCCYEFKAVDEKLKEEEGIFTDYAWHSTYERECFGFGWYGFTISIYTENLRTCLVIRRNETIYNTNDIVAKIYTNPSMEKLEKVLSALQNLIK